MYKIALFISLASVASSCKTVSIAENRMRQGSYTESLACYRSNFVLDQVKRIPKLTQKHKVSLFAQATSSQNIAQQLNDLLVDLRAYYAMTDSVQGYTIQVYTGGSRQLALEARNKLYTYYPSLSPEIRYNQPNFTVQIGRFLERLEAYRLYIDIKAMMPKAIIRPAYFLNEPGIFNEKSMMKRG